MQRKTSMQKPRKYSSIPAETELRELDEKEEKTVSSRRESVKETVVQVIHGQPSPLHQPPGGGGAEAVEAGAAVGGGDSLRRYIEVWTAEVFGSALLLCLGCMGGVAWTSDTPPHPAQSAAAFGMVVATLIQVFGHISAAHLNPCVSVCFYILGEVHSLPMLVNYIAAEAVGSVIGYGLLKALTPASLLEERPSLCCTLVEPRLALVQALALEFFSTGLLALLVCACSDPLNAAKQDSVPLKFGLFVAVISLLVGPYTGASINPTRTLAPAFWNGVWDNQWVYWVGPLLASVVFPLLYLSLFGRGGGREEGGRRKTVDLRRKSEVVVGKVK